MESTADVDVLVALFQMISADTFADTESDDMYAKVDGGRRTCARMSTTYSATALSI